MFWFNACATHQAACLQQAGATCSFTPAGGGILSTIAEWLEIDYVSDKFTLLANFFDAIIIRLWSGLLSTPTYSSRRV